MIAGNAEMEEKAQVGGIIQLFDLRRLCSLPKGKWSIDELEPIVLKAYSESKDQDDRYLLIESLKRLRKLREEIAEADKRFFEQRLI